MEQQNVNTVVILSLMCSLYIKLFHCICSSVFCHSPITASKDFEFNGEHHFTFMPDNFETPYCFNIAIKDDSVFEPPSEYFALSLSGEDGVSIKSGSHHVTILDDDSKLTTAFFLKIKCLCIILCM